MKYKPNWFAFLLIIIFILTVASVLGFLFLNSKLKQTQNKSETKSSYVSNNYDVSVYKDKIFPSTIKIKKDSQITWTNKDNVNHRIATDPYPADNGLEGFDSSTLKPNTSFSFLFSKTGTFTYHLEENPLTIKGVVIVE